MHGRGFMDFLSKANSFLKGSKLISTVGNSLAEAGVPGAGLVGSIAGKLGYGRRRRHRRYGGALGLAGMGRRVRHYY